MDSHMASSIRSFNESKVESIREIETRSELKKEMIRKVLNSMGGSVSFDIDADPLDGTEFSFSFSRSCQKSDRKQGTHMPRTETESSKSKNNETFKHNTTNSREVHNYSTTHTVAGDRSVLDGRRLNNTGYELLAEEGECRQEQSKMMASRHDGKQTTLESKLNRMDTQTGSRYDGNTIRSLKDEQGVVRSLHTEQLSAKGDQTDSERRRGNVCPNPLVDDIISGGLSGLISVDHPRTEWKMTEEEGQQYEELLEKTKMMKELTDKHRSQNEQARKLVESLKKEAILLNCAVDKVDKALGLGTRDLDLPAKLRAVDNYLSTQDIARDRDFQQDDDTAMLSNMESLAALTRSNTAYRHQVLFEKSKYYDEVDYKVDCILNNSIRSFVLSQNNYELWVDPDDSYDVKDFKRSFIDPEAAYHSRYVSLDTTVVRPERNSIQVLPVEATSHATLSDEEILNTLPLVAAGGAGSMTTSMQKSRIDS